MTDRELLELAAKAAGIHIDKSPHNGGGYGNTGFDLLGNAVLDWHNNKRWNPLADDGDALRLAVALDLSSLMIFSYIDGNNQGKRREFWTPNSGYDGGKSATTEAEYEADPYAATRRAIVRAAAEVGQKG